MNTILRKLVANPFKYRRQWKWHVWFCKAGLLLGEFTDLYKQNIESEL